MFSRYVFLMLACCVVVMPSITAALADDLEGEEEWNSKQDEDTEIGDVEIREGSSKCYCAHDNLCACCDHFEIPKMKINDTGCFELTYNAQQLAISLIFEIDNHVLMNKTVSARNPPPACYDVPHFDFAALCIQLYNLEFYQKQLTGCARALAELEGRPVFKRDIGCFHLPMSGGL
ncbi:hypothetical protein BV898_13572 [Hypsibius exemplaris]|uniref:DUF4773 domain-containing protein n=1 Tax=Hypsibius exemplaris TaxID=2072580 RepID=A0A1W0WAB6_HYPEX|nr:hypothetical protein BV898_13572 [Hypsibius exemplaris]